jgi:hypothetical protein
MKKILSYGFWAVATALISVACAPQDADQYSLGGKVEQLPSDWTVTAVDNDNTVEITFAPCTMIDGENVLGVQFACPEAGINEVVKDRTTTTFSKKVYTGGNYKLYVAAITRAGAGVPREVAFTVEKNLLLETLSLEILSEEVTLHSSHSDWATGHDETLYKGDVYIEKNSEITLTGDLANDDVVLNLDFFSRTSTSTAQFLGESGVYALYYNPVRKFVILSVPEPMIPNYLTLVGVGMGYPTTVSSEVIRAAYGAGSDGRGHSYWNYDNALSYILCRKIGDNVFQATITFEGTNNGFKPYVNNEGGVYTPWYVGDYGTDGIKYSEMTGGWTGSQIIESGDGNDWHTIGDIDHYQFYQFTIDISRKSVSIKKVSNTGEVLPDEPATPPTDPTGPVVSDNFDITTAQATTIGGEVFLNILHSLEQDAEYTLKSGLSDAEYNPAFFDRTAGDKVKFLGETGDYTLQYSPVRKVVILDAELLPGYVVSNDFDLATARIVNIDGEMFYIIPHSLTKDAEYTLQGSIADANIVYNPDFFDRTANNKVKFLGETGEYTLYFSPAHKNMILSVEAPDYPDYLVAVGKGFAYPSVNPYFVSNYPENARGSDILKHVLYRKIAANTYQATVMLKGGAGNLEFKAYHAKGGGDITNGWGNGGEYKYENCTFTGLANIFAGAGDGNNWEAGSALDETSVYRVTVTVTDDGDTKRATVDVQTVTLP